MSGKPQVTLTFAGDESKLTQSMDKVGAAARSMSTEVDASSKQIGASGEGFDRAGEAADGAEGKAQGFSDTLTGVSDIGSGTAEIMKGNLFEGFVTVGTGAADLAGGLATFLIPALKNGVSWIKNTTIAQRALSLAMSISPIGLIVIAIAALAAGLVIAYKKSETFRNIVNGAFGAVKNVAVGAFNWVKANWPLLLGIITGPIGLGVVLIGKHKDKILGFFKSVPGAIGGFFKGIGSTISAPFRAAFQGIKDAWNNTVGGKGFSVPDWVPEIGGKGFSIPYFHTGGIVSGAMGSETLAMLKAGERVTGGSNSGGGGVIVLKSDGTRTGKLLIQILREAIRIEGGDVQVVLGK